MPAKPPYLVAAVFCENVLQEQDGVVSAIRIIDRIFIPHLVEESSESKEVVALNLYVSFKGGGYVGKGTLRMVPVSPSGKNLSSQELLIEFPKEPNAGANVIVRAAIAFHEEGTHWFDVYFEGELVTRTPIDVQLMTQEMLQSLPAAGPGKQA